jgi:flagellar protein FlgJ
MTTSMKNIPATGPAETVKTEQANGRGNADSLEKRKAAVKKVSREFEALFAGMMLKSMRATVGKDSLTGGGRGEEVYRSLLDQEYAAAMVQGGGLGLGKLIEQQLERQIGYGDNNETRTKP